MHLPELIIGLAWIAFVTIWLAKNAGVKPAIMAEPNRQRIRYSLPAVIGTLVIVLGMRTAPRIKSLHHFYVAPGEKIIWAGVLVTLAGLVLTLWARAALGSNWGARVVINENHDLVSRGPYSRLRHPIYAGILLMLAGTVAVIGSAASAPGLVLVSWAVVVKLRYEEVLLLRHFGEPYRCYCDRTNRLIPLIW
jgi:protein-S-isoprenylcysteine O-methyltransferase Ste14